MTTEGCLAVTVSEWRRDQGAGWLRVGSDGHRSSGGLETVSRGPVQGADSPTLDPMALHGPLGRYVVAAQPYTESDPAAVLLGMLVGIGAAVGPGPYVWAGNVRHGASLYAAIVGRSAKAGLEGSWTAARLLLDAIDPQFCERRLVPSDVLSKMSLQDRLGAFTAAETRLLVFEPTLSRLIRMSRQDSSVLESYLRQAWDGHVRMPIAAPPGTSVHVGLLAHTTADELRSAAEHLIALPQLASRLVFVWARRTKSLPCGGNLPHELVCEHAAALGSAVDWAQGVGAMSRTGEGELTWCKRYEEMAADDPQGPLGIVVSRDVFHVLRLSMIYALVDRSPAIDEVHVAAAAALWRYCRQSAACLFRHRIDDVRSLHASIDPIAARLLGAIRRAGSAGLTLTQQSKVFGNNVSAARLEEARLSLEATGSVTTTRMSRQGPGRSPLITRAVAEIPDREAEA